MSDINERDSVIKLENDIFDCEHRLEALRKEYMARTGHMPARGMADFSWKWSIFMMLGFAYISMVVYLLGIAKAGRTSGLGIPSLFFSLDVAYFALLTFSALLMVIVIQAKKLAGYQSMALILGFWCAHWLVYDWSWMAYVFGIGSIGDPMSFWSSVFGRDFLVVDPPMWLFLTEAVVGGFVALYTFTFPRRKRELIPPVVWLYAVYANATICVYAGLDPLV
nr:hypothetical protein [Candidatus Sigynarchaeota archaeon]